MSRLWRWCLAAALLAGPVAVAAPGSRAPLASADDGHWGRSVPGEFVVELTSDADANRVNQAVGGIASPERLSPLSSVWWFRLPATTDPVAGTNLIKNAEDVVDVQPNVLADLPEFFGGRRTFWSDWEPADPTQPATAATVQQPALGFAGLPVPDATGSGTVVAVLDTGLDASHPMFAGRVAAGGRDVVGRDGSPAEERNALDDNGNGLVDEAFGHGTYVAGLVTIVAPDTKILPIRVLDSDGITTAWRILQGLDHADAGGADVINLSLGGEFLGALVERRVEQLEHDGVIVVAAAGNEATADLRYPAAFDGVVAVTAIDGRSGTVADFSNTGSWIDVAAPGVRVVSAYPGGRYATWGGTSASSPVATGTLALLRSLMPAADADDVVDRLTSTAVSNGLPNVSAYGRIDATTAVARAG